MNKTIQVEEGSGNAFADISLPNSEERLAALTVLLVWFGTYPGFILRTIQTAVRSLLA
jgi:NADH:ubiquinone oxidoreductase subunit 4 (subunit M)